MKTLTRSVILPVLLLMPIMELNATTLQGDMMDTPSSATSEVTALDSAPIVTATNSAPIRYTAWETMHRIPMLAGFRWTGAVTNFITPQMYIGTPFGDTTQSITQPLSDYLLSDATDYKQCLDKESYLSFGLGDRIEATDIAELKAIAKTCAQQYYGKYFEGKTYTAREEFLMMMFTMFGENVKHEGEFTENGTYIEKGTGVDSGFANVSPTSWSSPYIALASSLNIIPSSKLIWKIDQEISDTEAIDMLARYVAHRTNFSGSVLESGTVVTDTLKYTISFQDANEITIHVQ